MSGNSEDDFCPWEDGDFGKVEEFARKASPEDELKIQAKVDIALGLKQITFRMGVEEYNKYVNKAFEQGVTVQSLFRKVLADFWRENDH